MLTTKQGDEVRMTLKKMQMAFINISVGGGNATVYINNKKISEHTPILKYPVAAYTSIKVQAYNPQKGTYAEKILEVKPSTITQVHLNLTESRQPSGGN
jgi:hypothetical protein